MGFSVNLPQGPVDPDADLIKAEAAHLSRLIDRERDPARRNMLCAVYQALNWAAAPDRFAPWQPDPQRGEEA